MDLIDRQALLKQIDIDSDGEPGYYGDTWKFIDTIKRMPSALGTNLAEVGTDAISRQAAIDALRGYLIGKRCPDDGTLTCRLIENEVINKLPPAEPKKRGMSIEQEKMIVESLSSLYPIQKFEEDAIEVVLDALPSAEPKRGRWHYTDGKPARIGLSFGVVCDQCGTESEYCTNFCPNCGAKMEVTE